MALIAGIRRRLELVGVAIGMTGFTVAYFCISAELRWHPMVVAALGAVGVVGIAVLAAWPTTRWAYQMGGTFTVGAMLAHILSTGIGSFEYAQGDVVWLFMIHMILSTLLAVLFASWWLTSVKDWHYGQLRLVDERC